MSGRDLVRLCLLAALLLAPMLIPRFLITNPVAAAEYFSPEKRWFLFGWLLGLAAMFRWLERSSHRVRVSALVILGLGMVIVPALGSGDVFSAIARSVGIGLNENPFTSLPDGRLVDAWLPGTWHFYPTPYGPLWHYLPGWLFTIGQGSIQVAMELTRLVSMAASIGMLVIAIRLFGRSVNSLFILAPLVAFEMINNAHPESLMLMFLLLSLMFLTERRIGLGAAAFILAVSVKPIALLAAGMVFGLPVGDRWRWLGLAVMLGGLVTLPYLLNGGILTGVRSYADFMEVQTLSPFTALAWPAVHGLAAATVSADTRLVSLLTVRLLGIGLMVAVAALVLRRYRSIMVAAWLPFLLLIVFFPVNVQPWYLLWAIPLLLVAPLPIRSAAAAGMILGHAIAYLTLSVTGGLLIALGVTLIGSASWLARPSIDRLQPRPEVIE